MDSEFRHEMRLSLDAGTTVESFVKALMLSINVERVKAVIQELEARRARALSRAEVIPVAVHDLLRSEIWGGTGNCGKRINLWNFSDWYRYW